MGMQSRERTLQSPRFPSHVLGRGPQTKIQEHDWEMGEAMANDVTAIYDIPVQISAVLGRSSMQVSQLLKLGRGAVVELERLVGEEIELVAEENIIAKGEVVVIDDRLAVSITEIVKRR